MFRYTTRFMGRLNFSRKFIFLGALMAIPIIVLAVQQGIVQREQIATLKNERDGVRLAQPMLKVVQLIQKHRGLSAAVLGGNSAMESQRAALANDVSAAFDAADAALSGSKIGSFVEFQNDWKNIEANGMRMAGPDNLVAHKEAIAKGLRAVRDLADQSHLAMDSQVAGNHLAMASLVVIPNALEGLGRLRAAGTLVLTRHTLDPELKIALSVLIADLDTNLRQLHEAVSKTVQGSPELAGGIQGPLDNYEREAREIVALVKSDILTGNLATDPKMFFSRTTSLIDHGYGLLDATMLPTMDRMLAAREDQTTHAAWLVGSLALLGLAIPGFLAMAAFMSMHQALRNLQSGSDAMAAGDLRTHIEIESRDELHLIAQSVNHIAASMRAILAETQQVSGNVHSSAEQSATSAEKIAASSSAQSSAAENMAAAIEEFTVSVQQVSDSAQEMRRDAESAGNTSNEAADSVGMAVANMRQLAKSVTEASGVVRSLGAQSDHISVVISTIREIAELTNLLALNAAIEAARAGEHGRGFAVVADEVRKLAERTTRSTAEIGEMITGIQSGTASAVSAMEHSVNQVKQGEASAQTAGDAMRTVQQRVASVIASISHISEALREQTSAAQTVAREVETVAKMSEENAIAIDENRGTILHMERLATNLQGQVQRFQV